MLVINNQSYYIDKINSKYWGKNTFVDVQYAGVDLHYDFYKIYFDLKLYVANNFFLPADSLILNVKTPSFEVDEIQMFKINVEPDKNIPNIQHDVINVYQASFTLDISDNLFFNEKLNKDFDMYLSFDINTNSINENNSIINLKNFYDFINELKAIKLKIKLFHQNIIDVNASQKQWIVTSYFNDSINKVDIGKIDVNFFLNNLKNMTKNMYDLFELTFNDYFSFSVEEVFVQLHYFMNDVSKSAKIEFNSKQNVYAKKAVFSINDYETYFDEKNQEIVFQKGSNGINFPFDTYGNIEIEFKILINKKFINFKVVNQFSYFYIEDNYNFVIEPLLEKLSEYEELIVN